ncbi:MAG: PD40 domain-containing protein [Bacteroidetes bacterium]|nr:PD40 domain-containing protein [Bacteroidota bacterium]MBL7066397.1 PD40 domain-containing protein [Candidatus Neomarinimicrobiota bacterium]
MSKATYLITFIVTILVLFSSCSEFEDDEYETSSIYLMKVDGGAEVRLTDNKEEDYHPQFSPGGSRILFHSYRDREGLFIMNTDGSDLSLLVAGRLYDFGFSPDGSKILFSSYFGICVLNMDGSGCDTLTLNEEYCAYPRFSPDGSKIIFSVFREDSVIGGVVTRYIMESDRSNIIKLSEDKGWGWFFQEFSPDGSKIIYITEYEGKQSICIINIDGSGKVKLTDTYRTWDVKFSPGGSKLLFEAYSGDNYEIFIINSDGTNKTKLTDDPGDDKSPQFSPDGSKIIFVSDRDGNNEIYIMNVDGSDQTNLTCNTKRDDAPQFSPDGEKIVFQSGSE